MKCGWPLLVAVLPLLAQAPEPLVLRIRLENQAVTPVTARFLIRSLAEAETRNAQCLLLVLDTPGGLVDSTREIVKAMLRSKVPVVVYVAPSGARAASAGVFLTLAAHVSAMAPGTNIGAAHPVGIGGFPPAGPIPAPEDDGKKSRQPMEDKVVKDIVAWAQSLAELRGRNAGWAARTVRESISVSAVEAVRERAVDLLAESEQVLLTQLDGRTVTLPQTSVTLRTAAARIEDRRMWWGERLLSALANPTVAFLLLMFGFYGILFELYAPGWGIAGTLGIICLVLGFFALAVLPINYVGLALIFIAMGLFAAEAFVPSHGLLTVGGLVCLLLGGVMLVDSPIGFARVSLGVLIPVALATAAITGFLLTRLMSALRQPAQSGAEALSGATAIAAEAFSEQTSGYAGFVRIHGELWRAVSPSPVAPGDSVVVRSRDGLCLHVSADRK